MRRVHFVGIGGIGMSGIAQVMLNLGHRVSGSDLKETEITRRLRAAGARVEIGHRASNVGRADAVVTSSAVRPDNPEVRAARARRIPVLPRAAMLAELARLKKTVTVSGTHGKTTTTSMVAMALKAAGADPTMIIGGQLANIGTNARIGSGGYLVAEADESDGSFLLLSPLAAIVTNIDDDHLDHYGSMRALKDAFLRHINALPPEGAAVLCADDPALRGLLAKIRRPVITYALGRSADWRGRLLPAAAGRGARLDLFKKGRKVGRLELRVAGRHNASNALAAAAAADFLGFDIKKVLQGLAAFAGVGRRMERLGEAAGVLFIDDYGHHPTEVRATIDALRGLHPRRRLVVLFQPHRYSRTKALHRRFGTAFRGADAVYVADVYPAGEKPIPGVDSRLILASLARAGQRAEPFARAVDLARELRRGDLVLTLGAGDVWKTGVDLLRRLKSNALAAY